MNGTGREEQLERIREFVAFLCSRECLGRAPGTRGSEIARKRIVAELGELGAEPAGAQGYLQEVPGCGHNILARIPGRGPLADRAVLVAAHYDHLGAAGGGQAYWGADDNAAAVAILLEMARALQPDRLGRQVILAPFDGEEPPHFLKGSTYWVEHPLFPLDRIDMMVCMDLVGHAVGPEGFPEAVRESLFVLGAELSEGTPALIDALAQKCERVRPRRLGLDIIPPLSDYDAFHKAGVPVLFLTCGRWQHYHTVDDTPDKLDYDKIVATAGFLRDLVTALSLRPENPVVFDRNGRDDAASLASLRDIAALLEPLDAEAVDQIRPALDALSAAAARGRLSASEREMLSALAHGLESTFA